MQNTRRMKALLAVAAMFVCSLAGAHDDHHAIDVQHLRVVAVTTVGAPDATTAEVYLSVTNRSQTTERILSANTPLAERVVLRRTEPSAAAKPQEVATIEIAPGATLTMHTGDGPHLQLVGLKAPLKARSKQMLTLQFERAGKVDVPWLIKAPAAMHAH